MGVWHLGSVLVDGRPVTPAEARAIIAERYAIPPEDAPTCTRPGRSERANEIGVTRGAHVGPLGHQARLT